jgi:methylase of polypeptide subunit release factors
MLVAVQIVFYNDDIVLRLKQKCQNHLFGKGLDLVRKMLAQAADYLTEDGLIVIEVGNSEWAMRQNFNTIDMLVAVQIVFYNDDIVLRLKQKCQNHLFGK